MSMPQKCHPHAADFNVEDEIAKQLESVELNVSDDEEDGLEVTDEGDGGDLDEQLPDSMLQYLQRVQYLTDHVQQELDTCDVLLTPSDTKSGKNGLSEGTQLLIQIAKEEGQDPEQLKAMVLAALEREDQEDEKVTAEDMGKEQEFCDNDQEKLRKIADQDSHENKCKTETSCETDSAFVMTKNCTEEKYCKTSDKHAEEAQSLVKDNGVADINSNHDGNGALDTDKYNGEIANSLNDTNQIQASGRREGIDVNNGEGLEIEEVADVNAGVKHSTDVEYLSNSSLQQPYEQSVTPAQVHENTCEGEHEVMPTMEVNIVALEETARQQVRQLQEKLKQQEQQRKREEEMRRAEEEQAQKAIEAERLQKQQQIKEEEQRMLQERQEREEVLAKEAEVEQRGIQEALDLYQAEIEALVLQTQEEQKQFQLAKQEQQQRLQEQQTAAAVKIQTRYRGYRIKKEFKTILAEKRQERKQKKEEERIKSIEEQRKKEKDEKFRKEEEERMKEEEKKRKLEEEKRRQEEERRKEEERKRAEEKRKEEEKKRKAEEKKRKEEEKKKAEEQKRREEAERKRKEEEAKMKKEEEEKRKKEDEEKRKKEEEEKRKEEMKRLEEKQREQRKQEEEQKRKEEEENKRKEEERKRREAEKLEAKRLKQEDNRKREEIKQKLEEEQQRQLAAQGTLKNDQAAVQQAGNKSTTGKRDTPRADMVPTSPLKRKQDGSSTARTPRSARKIRSTISVTEALEQRRLAWMKQCKPWSKVESELKSRKISSNKRALRRPPSAKNLAPVTEDVILGAAQVSSLQQVTTVELRDLPGTSIQSLGQCPHLQVLIVQCCGLVVVDGINTCKQLQYLDFTNNNIEMVHIKDLEKLLYLNLSHNNLTSIHGLEGCPQLCNLNVDHNRITRITGLDSLKKLHTLSISHNQLISSRGVGIAVTLQDLDLSHNHLSSMDDMDSLCLLQRLNVSANNLLQPPQLLNNVLLLQLSLVDNSISTLQRLIPAWLPLLHQLTVSHNSLIQLDPLGGCISLQSLDISNNQILDVDSLLPGLGGYVQLKELNVSCNPVMADSKCRSAITSKLPCLQKLDGASIDHQVVAPAEDSFQASCSSQIQQLLHLQEAFVQALKRMESSTKDYSKLCREHRQFYSKSFQLAVELRYMHEYGNSGTEMAIVDDISLTRTDTILESARDSSIANNSNVTANMKNAFDAAVSKANVENSKPQSGRGTPRTTRTHDGTTNTSVRASTVSKMLQKEKVARLTRSQEVAATKIQALWRGYSLRKALEDHSQMWLAASTIQAVWRGHAVRKRLGSVKHGQPSQQFRPQVSPAEYAAMSRAAVKIQALWRGYRIRKILQSAYQYARLDEDDEFPEIDLGDFDFSEMDFEKDWLPPDTPQLPANHAVLAQPASHRPTAGQMPPFFDKPHPPNQPRQAWRNQEPAMSDRLLTDSPVARMKPPLPPTSRMSDLTADTHATSIHSRKEDKLSEEWGFKDTRTAELMMQRAKKLKYNATRKKKLAKLDPRQRLALLRKLEQSTKITPVQPPVRKALPRKEYFQARQAEEEHKEQEKAQEYHHKAQRTFEWLHTQVTPGYEVTSSRIQQQGRSSEGNLPHLDPGVLAGRLTQLTGSPVSIEIQSVESASQQGDSRAPRRHSFAESPSDPVMLPPIKTTSAPTVRPNEKMSWRRREVNQSVGWGGGKKRATVRKH